MLWRWDKFPCKMLYIFFVNIFMLVYVCTPISVANSVKLIISIYGAKKKDPWYFNFSLKFNELATLVSICVQYVVLNMYKKVNRVIFFSARLHFLNSVNTRFLRLNFRLKITQLLRSVVNVCCAQISEKDYFLSIMVFAEMWHESTRYLKLLFVIGSFVLKLLTFL